MGRRVSILLGYALEVWMRPEISKQTNGSRNLNL